MQLNLPAKRGKEYISDELIHNNGELSSIAYGEEDEYGYGITETQATDIYGLYTGHKGVQTEYSADIFGTDLNEPYGFAEDDVYTCFDTSKGVHNIKLNRKLENGESIIVSWKNHEQIKIASEIKYDSTPDGLVPVRDKDGNIVYETHIYNSAGGAYNEIGLMIDESSESGKYTFDDTPNRFDYTEGIYTRRMK